MAAAAKSKRRIGISIGLDDNRQSKINAPEARYLDLHIRSVGGLRRFPDMLSRFRYMDAALRFIAAAPATGTRVFTRRGPAGARHTPDRLEARCGKRMLRQIRIAINRRNLIARSARKRVEFQPRAVFFDDGDGGTSTALE